MGKRPIKRRPRPQSYIHNLATSLMSQFGVECTETTNPQDLWGSINRDVRKWVSQCNSRTRSRIAECGEGANEFSISTGIPLIAVHQRTWLDKFASGKELIIEIATTAIIAAMIDVLRARARRLKAAFE